MTGTRFDAAFFVRMMTRLRKALSYVAMATRTQEKNVELQQTEGKKDKYNTEYSKKT